MVRKPKARASPRLKLKAATLPNPRRAGTGHVPPRAKKKLPIKKSEDAASKCPLPRQSPSRRSGHFQQVPGDGHRILEGVSGHRWVVMECGGGQSEYNIRWRALPAQWIPEELLRSLLTPEEVTEILQLARRASPPPQWHQMVGAYDPSQFYHGLTQVRSTAPGGHGPSQCRKKAPRERG